MTVAVGVMVPLVCMLGFWQLDRGAEKRRYQEVLFARMAAPAVAPPDAGQLEPFVRIRLEGEFEEQRYFLVDNQIADGKVGYWVVHSFSAADGRRWLVNRGWFPAGLRRESLPAVPAPSGPVVTVGVAWPETGLVPLLAAGRRPDGAPFREWHGCGDSPGGQAAGRAPAGAAGRWL